MSGVVPETLGSLAKIETLFLNGNTLTGLIPESFLRLNALQSFSFGNNASLCVPNTDVFQTWLGGIATHSGPVCP